MKQFLALFFVLASTASQASVVWTGDFETGSIDQWSKSQIVSADRIRIQTTPVRQGKYVGKFIVKQGDDPINASGNRSELVRLTNEAPGSEYFYKFNTMFTLDFPNVNKWQLFVQWHQKESTGSPPVEFYVVGNEMRLRVGGSAGRVVWTAPLVRGSWNDFVFHVKWSADPNVGFVELYRNGKLEMPKRFIATQFSNSYNYLKVGLYRDESIAQIGEVFHDGMVMATQLSDVMPATTAARAFSPVASDDAADLEAGAPADFQDPEGPTEESYAHASEAFDSELGSDPAVGCSSAPVSPSFFSFAVVAAALACFSVRRQSRRA